jgi:hypothetical protein
MIWQCILLTLVIYLVSSASLPPDYADLRKINFAIVTGLRIFYFNRIMKSFKPGIISGWVVEIRLGDIENNRTAIRLI